MCFFRRTKKYRPVSQPQALGNPSRIGDVALLQIGAGVGPDIEFEGALYSAVDHKRLR